MNLKQLKEFLALCKTSEVKEIVFGSVHVQFHGKGSEPEQESDQVVIQALGGEIACQGEEDADGSED